MWRHAIVILILKKGHTDNPSSYRPVSLTCALSKVMEKLLYESIMSYLRDKNLFSKQQFGFMQNSSAVHYLLSSQDDNLSINVKNIDFELFYSIPRKPLIAFLTNYCFIK